MRIKSAFLNQPIEVSEFHPQFLNVLGLGASMPQLLIRLGYTEAMPNPLRRLFDAVLI